MKKQKELTYEEFLKQKEVHIQESGFEVKESELNSMLFDFQKWIVQRALKLGMFGVFADAGLGKTFISLEWAKHVIIHTNKPVIIAAPLAVSMQTIGEGEKFGIEVEKLTLESYPNLQAKIYITNYEQLHKFDLSVFSGVVLDESGIIKNHEGKTKNLIVEMFANTHYKLACSATPSPNDAMELGNHS